MYLCRSISGFSGNSLLDLSGLQAFGNALYVFVICKGRMMYYYPGQPASPYGLPISPKKRGRPSDLSKLQAVQGDLFLAELMISKDLSTAAGPRPERSEDGGTAAGQAESVEKLTQRLYVPVTRKVSAKSDTKDGIKS